MPKYMFKANYSQSGLEGLTAEGGTGRLKAVEAAAASVGGALESMYYAFGDTDLYAIADLPDDEAAASLALKVAVSGFAQPETIKLLTPEQVDEALRRGVSYRPPGN
jgi:uncharacterized protein with GYD domain